MAFKKQTSPLSPPERAIHDILDAIENDRIAQREATRPPHISDLWLKDRVERWGNVGRDFRHPQTEVEYYINSEGDIEAKSPFEGKTPVVYDASAHPLGLPIKAYEQIYKELGPEGVAHKRREEFLLKGFPERTPQHMREGPYGRVVVPTKNNGIQIVNSKQDPAYYQALANQQFNYQRYYEMEFDKLRGIGPENLGLSQEDAMKKFQLYKTLTPEILQVNRPENVFEASALEKIASRKKHWYEFLGKDVDKQYDRQLLLQSMLATGKLDSSPIPQLYGNLQDSVKNARGALPLPPYNFISDSGTPDHPYVGNNYTGSGNPDTDNWRDGIFEKLPRKSQEALLPAIDAMLAYNRAMYKIPELKPPLSQYTGRFNKGGYLGSNFGPQLETLFDEAIVRDKNLMPNARGIANKYQSNPNFRSAVNKFIPHTLRTPAAGAVGGVLSMAGQVIDATDSDYMNRNYRGTDPFAIRPFYDLLLAPSSGQSYSDAGRAYETMVSSPEYIQRNPLSSMIGQAVRGDNQYLKAFAEAYIPDFSK